MELEVRPANEAERFVAFARANGYQCRVLFSGRPRRLTFDVPLARDRTEARLIALEVIGSFSAEKTRADVRVKIAVACRCAQEVRKFMPDPTVDG